MLSHLFSGTFQFFLIGKMLRPINYLLYFGGKSLALYLQMHLSTAGPFGSVGCIQYNWPFGPCFPGVRVHLYIGSPLSFRDAHGGWPSGVKQSSSWIVALHKGLLHIFKEMFTVGLDAFSNLLLKFSFCRPNYLLIFLLPEPVAMIT